MKNYFKSFASVILCGLLGLSVGIVGCKEDDKVYEKKVEHYDEEGNVQEKYHKEVTQDEDGTKETTVVTESN